MVIPNCEGCLDEYYTMCDAVDKGFHIATTKDNEFVSRGHFMILVVDNNGKRMIW